MAGQGGGGIRDPLEGYGDTVMAAIRKGMSERQVNNRVLAAGLETCAADGNGVGFQRLRAAGGSYHQGFRSHGTKRTMLGSAAFGMRPGIVSDVLSDSRLGLSQLNTPFGPKRDTPLCVAAEQMHLV